MIKGAGVVTIAGVLAGAGASQAHQEMFVAYLDGKTQSPANTSFGVGTMLVTLDVDIATMHVQMKFNGLSGDVSSMGLHGRTVAPETGVAALAVPFPDAPVGNTHGEYDSIIDLTQGSSYTPNYITASGGTISDALNSTIFGLLREQMYVNIPTSAFPDGEVRGFASSWPDAVRDGKINTLDFDALAAHFNSAPTDISSGDFNLDGRTNALDFNTLAQRFGDSVDFVLDPPEALLPVPEPCACALLAPFVCWLSGMRLQSLHTVGP